MLLEVTVSSLLLLTHVRGQEFVAECPSPNGFFADAVQCDKYYHCVDNVLTEKLCPDGKAFNDLNPSVEKCDLHYQVDCTGRPELQAPQPTENCPRQNGYFPDPDPTNCRQFYYCAGGLSNQITCPESLAFSTNTGTCVWPNEAGRSNCVSEKVHNFTCPKVEKEVAIAHPRYADPDDCQYFYVCVNGDTPRRNGCSFGQVFNTNTTTCDAPKNVLECKDYYTEYFDNYFKTLGAGSGVPRISTEILNAALASGYPVPNFRDRVRIKPGAPVPTRRGTTDASAAIRSENAPSRNNNNRPGNRPLRRRRPGNRRRPRPTTTTTTTTTTPPPEYEYYYYYDDDLNNTALAEEDLSSPVYDYYVDSVPPVVDTEAPVPSPADVPGSSVIDVPGTGPADSSPVAPEAENTDPIVPDRGSVTRTNVPIIRPFSRPGN